MIKNSLRQATSAPSLHFQRSLHCKRQAGLHGTMAPTRASTIPLSAVPEPGALIGLRDPDCLAAAGDSCVLS